MDVIEAEAGFDQVARDDEAVALTGRNPNLDALADEIIAKPLDIGIGDDVAVVDARIDQGHGAELRPRDAEIAAIDPYRFTRLEKAGRAFGHAETEHEILGGDGCHRIARHHHRADGERHREHPPAGRGLDLAFRELLLGERAFGLARLERACRDLGRRRRLIELLARHRAALGQGLRAPEIDLGLGELGFEAVDLGVERLDTKAELLVGHHADHLARLHLITLAHGEARDGAADARPRRHHIPAFDGREDRFLVGQMRGLDGKTLRRQSGCGKSGKPEDQQEESSHEGCLRIREKTGGTGQHRVGKAFARALGAVSRGQ